MEGGVIGTGCSLFAQGIFLLLVVFNLLASSQLIMATRLGNLLKLPSEVKSGLTGQVKDAVSQAFLAADGDDGVGTRWALLIAGSNGYWNYRHQADVCHAYQLLRKNGLKDENIVVFMYDDIANNPENPRPGVIINSPDGSDVYAGVPKDYTGENVTVSNFLGALLGVPSAISGGSGKVIASGPNDHVFVFYDDHGGPGVLGMPTFPFLFADDIVDTLKAKHAIGGYKELVFYLEACESGSIFQGLLPPDIKIFATTASNAEESSWGTYCPGMTPSPPQEFETCLGDLYSVAWMEDSDVHNLEKEKLLDQYKIVRRRTSNNGSFQFGSHVMMYGDSKIDDEQVAVFIGTDPANDGSPPGEVPDGANRLGTFARQKSLTAGQKMFYAGQIVEGVEQRDADVLHFWTKYENAPEGSERRRKAREEFDALVERRVHVDSSIRKIAEIASSAMFPEVSQTSSDGSDLSSAFINLDAVRGGDLPIVDDWQCLRQMVRAYETSCGHLTQYGMKYMRIFANMCNMGMSVEDVKKAAASTCPLVGTTMRTSYAVAEGQFSA